MTECGSLCSAFQCVKFPAKIQVFGDDVPSGTLKTPYNHSEKDVNGEYYREKILK